MHVLGVPTFTTTTSAVGKGILVGSMSPIPMECLSSVSSIARSPMCSQGIQHCGADGEKQSIKQERKEFKQEYKGE